MALPEGFESSSAYFRKAVNLLYEFRWLYVYPNTDVFKSHVLDHMPFEWRVYFQSVSPSELDLEGAGAPASLSDFIKRLKALMPSHAMTHATLQRVHLECTHGLSFKKQHEITLLAPLIQDYCRANNIDYVIDVGCGLGYLTSLLYEQDIKIMGIDGNAKFIKTAQLKHPQIPYEHLCVTSDSAGEIITLLQRNFVEYNENMHRVCLIALHACADLTVDMLKLSVLISTLKLAIVMPCCYHRMKQDSKKSAFLNFPLSIELQAVLSCINENFLNVAFLRLACQRVNRKYDTMEERDVQTDNLMFRNLLQLVVDEENLNVQRRRRKTGSHRGDYTIDRFLTNLASYYEISHAKEEGAKAISEQTLSRLKLALRHNYERTYADQKSTLAAFAALQNLIQPVCENLVLLDRCVFVGEAGNKCVTLKITDECISPRCFALVVTKQ